MKKGLSSRRGELRAQIAYLYLCQGFKDSKILSVLSIDISPIQLSALQKIRKDLGLYHRLFERAKQEGQLQTIIASELDDSGIEGYGRRLLYTHFRTMDVNATRFGFLKLLPLLLTYLETLYPGM